MVSRVYAPVVYIEISPHVVISDQKSQGRSQFLSYITISPPIYNTKQLIDVKTP